MARTARWLVASAAMTLVCVGVARAHDIWLRPRPFVLVRGDTLVVEQLVGSELAVETELELMRTVTRRFELVTSRGTLDLLAELPDFRSQPTVMPILERKLDEEGQALVVMDHAFIENVFTEQQFLEYLDHEELDPSAFRPHMAGRTEQVERYARTLKTLVHVGDPTSGDLHRQIVGQMLELVLLQNPYLLDPGDELEVQVLFEGTPLPDQLVTAFNYLKGWSMFHSRHVKKPSRKQKKIKQ